MDDPVLCEFENQFDLIEKSLNISKCIKEKYLRVLNEKQMAVVKCSQLEDKIARMNVEKCRECSILRNKLLIERGEKEKIRKEEKTNLLQRIAEMVAGLDEKNNQMTNAQLLTQLVCDGVHASPPSLNKKEITLIDDRVREECFSVLVNETVVPDSDEESNESSYKLKVPAIIIPETEPTEWFQMNHKTDVRSNKVDIAMKKRHQEVKDLELNHNKKEDETDQKAKKFKISPSFEHLKESRLEESSSRSTSNNVAKSDANQDRGIIEDSRQSSSSSVFAQTVVENRSAMINDMGDSDSQGMNTSLARDSRVKDKPAASWMLKSSLTVSDGSAVNGKKLKQTTLSLARPEKKQDISLSQGFKGGLSLSSRNKKNVAQVSNEEDVILPSPEAEAGTSLKMRKVYETLEDPDITIFQPAVTSTCIPSVHESSYDRLPERSTSPSFKYRRETVRKKNERMKLPGQQCDDCAKYYEAAGLDKSQEIRKRMNKCSRHRDKFDVQIHTPPGFWDPVIPVTPKGSQE